MGWTEARMDTLRTMWLAGESAKRISEALGEVSRNAVMGKVHRMGLMGSPEHNTRITGRIFGACRPIMPAEAIDVSPDPVTLEIVDVVAREVPTIGIVQPDPGVGIAAEGVEASEAKPIMFQDDGAVEAEEHLVVRDNDADEVDPDEAEADGFEDEEAEESVAEEDEVEDEDGSERGEDRRSVEPILLDDIDQEDDEEDEPAVAVKRRRYPSIRKVEVDLPSASAAPEVVRITGGVIATAHDGTERGVVPDWRHAVSVVARLTGQDFDVKRPGHRGSLVAVATILAGDPRRILCPRMGEPEVLQMMRRLATGGMIVGGKSPERWRDPVEGDASFFDDMLTVEEVKDRWRVRIERAPSDAAPMPIAA